MTAYTLTAAVGRPFAETLDAVRAALGEEGFGVLTEIDLASTLREKVGADLPPQVILGACRPQLAHQAVLADPSVAALLPCNVVVRSTGDDRCVVEAFDPAAMVSLGSADVPEALREVADDARARLTDALARLG
ncbi:MAG: ABC transporter [Nocardioides sp.]|nr:ABC transporter [Nocardioides sp.]